MKYLIYFLVYLIIILFVAWNTFVIEFIPLYGIVPKMHDNLNKKYLLFKTEKSSIFRKHNFYGKVTFYGYTDQKKKILYDMEDKEHLELIVHSKSSFWNYKIKYRSRGDYKIKKYFPVPPSFYFLLLKKK